MIAQCMSDSIERRDTEVILGNPSVGQAIDCQPMFIVWLESIPHPHSRFG